MKKTTNIRFELEGDRQYKTDLAQVVGAFSQENLRKLRVFKEQC